MTISALSHIVVEDHDIEMATSASVERHYEVSDSVPFVPKS
jgi:hypothetical protein